VSITRNPLLINVGFIMSQSVGASREIPFELPQLMFPPDLELTQVNGIMHLDRTRQGILVHFDFRGTVILECVRCLENYNHVLHTKFSELFAFDRRSVTESGLILRDDANIDAYPLLREFFLLDVPIRPLCKPDCRGLCLECGVNLNNELCEHNKQAIY
jgi:uncharacterized protein